MRALNAALSPESSLSSNELAGRIQITGDIVHVRGNADSYRVHVSTGAIFRDSDGQPVKVSALDSRFGELNVPEFGGVTELFKNILILLQDSDYRTALTPYRE